MQVKSGGCDDSGAAGGGCGGFESVCVDLWGIGGRVNLPSTESCPEPWFQGGGDCVWGGESGTGSLRGSGVDWPGWAGWGVASESRNLGKKPVNRAVFSLSWPVKTREFPLLGSPPAGATSRFTFPHFPVMLFVLEIATPWCNW